MSQMELQRLAAAIQADPAIAQPLLSMTTPQEIGALLRSEGYDISDDEIAESTRASAQLSDAQLDNVSGGLLMEAFAIGIILLTTMGVGAAVGIAAQGIPKS